jgi:hypothetical protein
MKHTMHGLSTTVEYLAWKSMRWRCNPKNKASRRYYFDKGVLVCADWNTFPPFLAHIGSMPAPGMEVDRIDGTKGYEPGNVRWATRIEQMRNMLSTRKVTIGGRTLPLTEWAEISGIHIATLTYRLQRKWPESELLSSNKWRHRRGRCA